MGNRRTLILILIGVVCLTNTILIVLQFRKTDKTVVIDIIKVVEEFHLKKNLEGRAAAKLSILTGEIDSLTAVQSYMQKNDAGQANVTGISRAIDSLRENVQQAYVRSNKAVNEQVWQRLNSLLTSYGKSHNYRLVIGANGMGTVLYNEDGIDRTQELIEYINKSYDTGR
jgi:outer membrane protein